VGYLIQLQRKGQNTNDLNSAGGTTEATREKQQLNEKTLTIPIL